MAWAPLRHDYEAQLLRVSRHLFNMPWRKHWANQKWHVWRSGMKPRVPERLSVNLSGAMGREPLHDTILFTEKQLVDDSITRSNGTAVHPKSPLRGTKKTLPRPCPTPILRFRRGGHDNAEVALGQRSQGQTSVTSGRGRTALRRPGLGRRHGSRA